MYAKTKKRRRASFVVIDEQTGERIRIFVERDATDRMRYAAYDSKDEHITDFYSRKLAERYFTFQSRPHKRTKKKG
jgi:acyl-CoA synthetase (AMP-forming)/AMP-acid ligase II